MPTFITPTTLTVSGTSNAWHSLSTTSSGVPQSATGVILLFSAATTSCTLLLRKTGSSNSPTCASMNTPTQCVMMIGVDGNQSFDWQSSAANAGAGNTLWLLGYFGSEAQFIEPWVSLGTTSTSYGTIDVSSTAAAGSKGVIVQFATSPGAIGLRPNGVTDDWFTNLGAQSPQQAGGVLVGIDGNNKFQCKTINVVTINLIGYISAGLTWNSPSAKVVTPASSGSLQALSTEAGGIGYLYQMSNASTAYAWTIANGSSSSLPNETGCRGSGNMCYTGSTPFANIANTALSVNELAYFTPVIGGTDTLLGAGWV